MIVNFYLFAKLRELCEKDIVSIEIELNTSLKNAIDKLVVDYPSIQTYIKVCRFSKNLKYIKDLNILLQDNDQIYIIPPISSG
jgi:molybdopterin converting factor small subunit